MNTSKIHINNLYIKYTFVHFAILLIRQVSMGSFASSDHFLCRRSTQFQAWVQLWVSSREWQLACHSSLKFPFFSFAPFLETSGLVNHQHLMLFLDFYLHQFQHREELGNRFHHPLHIIVHHEVLVTW